MKFLNCVIIALTAILFAVVSPALASSIACTSGSPTTISATEGAHIVLTASPDSSEYTYDWTVGTAFNNIQGLNTKTVSFNVPELGASGTYTVQLVMKPTGTTVDACKDTCLYTVTIGGLCGAPNTADACIAVPTTWTYTCPNCPGTSCPETLFYEWWVSQGTTAPVSTSESSWGTNQVSDARTYTPSSLWAGFNVPTPSDPITKSWVSFIVRQDTGAPVGPDKVIKFFTKEVTLYYNPDTTMDSDIT